MPQTTQPATDSDLARRIRAVRQERALSQAALARASGLDRTAISKIESGRRRVGSAELVRLAHALEVPLHALVGEDEPEDPPELQSLHALRHEIERIARAHGASEVRVFGSVGRRQATAESDIDLLVNMEPGRSLFDIAALRADLGALLGKKVDVATVEGLRDRIRERVLDEAVPL